MNSTSLTSLEMEMNMETMDTMDMEMDLLTLMSYNTNNHGEELSGWLDDDAEYSQTLTTNNHEQQQVQLHFPSAASTTPLIITTTTPTNAPQKEQLVKYELDLQQQQDESPSPGSPASSSLSPPHSPTLYSNSYSSNNVEDGDDLDLKELLQLQQQLQPQQQDDDGDLDELDLLDCWYFNNNTTTEDGSPITPTLLDLFNINNNNIIPGEEAVAVGGEPSLNLSSLLSDIVDDNDNNGISQLLSNSNKLDEEDMDLTLQFENILTTLPHSISTSTINNNESQLYYFTVEHQDVASDEKKGVQMLVDMSTATATAMGQQHGHGSASATSSSSSATSKVTAPVGHNRSSKKSTTATVTETTPKASTSKSKKSTTTKKRSKLEKIERKKEQNKSAATRYREKKKLQATIIQNEESLLESVNLELITKKSKLATEINIIKSCIRELIKSSGSGNKNKKRSSI